MGLPRLLMLMLILGLIPSADRGDDGPVGGWLSGAGGITMLNLSLGLNGMGISANIFSTSISSSSGPPERFRVRSTRTSKEKIEPRSLSGRPAGRSRELDGVLGTGAGDAYDKF